MIARIDHRWVRITATLAALASALDPLQGRPPDSPARYGGPLAEILDLAEPTSLAVGKNDEIYVLETLADRVRVVDAQGKELRRFGERGSNPGQLLSPRGIAIAPDGEVYVSDSLNDRVQAFTPEGRFLRTFGIRGAGPAEMNLPLGLAATRDRVYVADSRNHRVQVFRRDGRFLSEVGGTGSAAPAPSDSRAAAREPPGLAHPVDVAVDEDRNLYVADADHHRIAKFDPRGAFVKAWGGHGPYSGLFLAPSGIRWAGGRLYVADRDNHRVQVYDTQGELLYEWGVHALRPHEAAGKLHYPNQVAIAPSGRFAAIAEAFEDRVQLFGPENDYSRTLQRSQEKSTGAHYGSGFDAAGVLYALLEPEAPCALLLDTTLSTPVEITRFGSFGAKPGQMSRPVDVELDPKGAVAYVSDPGLARVSAFSVARAGGADVGYEPALARFVRSVDLRALSALEPALAGTSASSSPADSRSVPWPIEPGAIEKDGAGNLWLLDTANSRIVVLDPELRFLRVLLRHGTGDERLLDPTDLAITRGGDVLVVDAGECRVKIFDSTGRALTAFGRRGEGQADFVRPFGIALGPDGSIHVTDESGHRVKKFDSRGRLMGDFGRKGLGRVEFYRPRGLGFDPRGRLVVVDHGNHRGQVLSDAGEFVDAFGARLFIQDVRRKP